MRFRTIGLAAGVFALALATTARAQDFSPALELSTITNPAAAKALENQVSGSTLTSGTFGGQEVHQMGLGIRLGGYGFGAGASLRYFFGGPLGVQAEVSHYGFVGYGITELQAAVIYRLKDNKLSAPLIITPYVGGGIAFAHSSFDNTYIYLGQVYGIASQNDTGAVILGGADVFLEKIPKIGISAQFTFDTIDNGVIGSYGGAGGSIAAHWYFK